jgi:hypothetical protein
MLHMRHAKHSQYMFWELQELTGLTGLEIHAKASRKWLDEVCQLTGLRRLVMEGPFEPERVLLGLMQLRQLTYLRLNRKVQGNWPYTLRAEVSTLA